MVLPCFAWDALNSGYDTPSSSAALQTDGAEQGSTWDWCLCLAGLALASAALAVRCSQLPHLQLPDSQTHTAAAPQVCTCVQATSVDSPTALLAKAGQ